MSRSAGYILSKTSSSGGEQVEMFERYRYSYVSGAVLDIHSAEQILQSIEKGLKIFEVEVDLGLRKTVVEADKDAIYLEGAIIPVADIKAIREGFAYKVLGGSLRRLDVYSDGKYYKLKPTAPGKAPTLEINGIHMHRIHGVDPWTDSLAKVRAAGRVIKGARVLDICTGLGYTAIAETLLGATSVTTIEVDRNVLAMASLNPWSRGLENPRIEIIVGDAFYVLDDLEKESFNVVIHDPPRFETAGELYSLEFYRKVYRVLRKGGVLVHYTGTPGKHSNIDILKGVKKRLSEAGFSNIVWIGGGFGIQGAKNPLRISQKSVS